MTGPWRWMLLPLYLHYLSATAKATYVQEFLPRSLSPYGDGLEGAQLLQIPMPQQSGALLLSVAANVTRGCSWTNITLYLRHDGLPIVNVQNASYPNYTWVNEPVDYEINFLSDSLPHNLTINFRDSSLMIFGAAFLMEESTKIQQDGLTKTCTTLFWARVETALLDEADIIVDDLIEDLDTFPLVRKNYVQPLTVKWIQDQGNSTNLTSNSVDTQLNLQSGDPPVILQWAVGSPTDVGGTLVVDVKFNQGQKNASVSFCLSRMIPACENGTEVNADTSLPEKKAKVIVPYPRSGNWYLLLVGNCTELNGTICERNISVTIQISLSACNEGSCGPHGRCVQYFSSGLIYSTCLCSSGFAGWSCSDNSNALSTTILLASVLILTLSNLFFLPAIVMSYLRGFYPQCLMYFLTMFFSSFYHACDQPEFNFCLMPYSILQFGDFYASLTSVWLTALIVADPIVKDTVANTISLAGVVAIAVGVHYNATSLPTFIVPIVGGLFLITVSWIHHGYRRRSCYPGKSYCLKAVLPCLVFSLIGLVCFAFLETEKNYFYVHSIWHISIALAILFILPAKGEPANVTKL